MDNQRIIELYEKYRSRRATAQEQQEFEQLLDSPAAEKVLKALFDSYCENLDPSVVWQVAVKNSDFIFSDIVSRPQQQLLGRKRWKQLAVAASVLLACAMGWYAYEQRTAGKEQAAYATDVAPGRNGAMLTLSNGRKILVNEALAGNIASENGVRIVKANNGQLVYELTGAAGAAGHNVLSTARGEQAQVRLPEGTLVFLNAESSLRYPVSFTGLDRRDVSLTGEGYFEVVKDKLHPFIVRTEGQQVEVLGTHFNVNGYIGEGAVRTTLLEGSVKVRAGEGQQGLLRPGQQATVAAGNLQVSEADTELATAWKNNKFMFESQQISGIMRMVQRWYNVQVVYEGPVPTDRFSGTVSRFGNVSQVLRILESSGGVHFRIEEAATGKEKTIYVSRSINP